MRIEDVKPRNAGEMRWHLFHVHGLVVSDLDDKGLRECHREEHETEFTSHKAVPHDHGHKAPGSTEPGK